MKIRINTKKVGTLCKRDLVKIIKGKSFLYVLLAQFIVISLTVTSFTHLPALFSQAKIPSRILSVGVAGDYEFYAFSERNLNITLYYYSTLKDAWRAYQEGYINAIIFSDNFSAKNIRPLLVRVYSSERATSPLLISRLKDGLEKKAAELRNKRIKKFKPQLEIITLKEPVFPKSIPVTVIYSLLLPLFFLSAVTLAGTLMINLMGIEIERKTLEDLMVSPLSKRELILSRYLTPVFLTLLQVSLWIFLLNLAFPIYHLAFLLLLALFYALIFISLGLISILISRERDIAQNIYTLFLIPTFLFLLPLPVSFIEKLGFIKNLLPVFLITRLSFISELSLESFLGFLLTGLFSLGLLYLSLKLVEKYL